MCEDAVFLHGESSHVGRMKTNRNECAIEVEHAKAWRATCCMFFGSYSELAMHEPGTL